jgi:hypothetical protein
MRPTTELADPGQATKAALRRLAHRYQQLTKEIRDFDAELAPLVTATAPQLLALPGVGMTSPANCWSLLGITPTGCTPKPPLPTSAVSPRSPPAPDAPTATD